MSQNRMSQAEAFKPSTALTASGGATPSVIGNWIEIGSSGGDISLFLENAGLSTSLTVTYQLGYIKRVNESTRTITAMTPTVAGVVTGAISDFTAVNIASAAKHSSISIATTQHIRFICTNVDAVNAANVSLYAVYQEA